MCWPPSRSVSIFGNYPPTSINKNPFLLLKFGFAQRLRGRLSEALCMIRARYGVPGGTEKRLTEQLDLKKTINLPKTKFSMKANLPVLESRMLEEWEEMDLRKQMRGSIAELIRIEVPQCVPLVLCREYAFSNHSMPDGQLAAEHAVCAE